MRNVRNVIAALRRWHSQLRPRRTTYIPQRDVDLTRGLR